MLVKRLSDVIRSEGPISFARFMEAALYDPADGYYARGASRLGPQGDFVTASDVGHAFGRCVGRQIAEIDAALGPFRPCDVLEFGAGRGRLGRDLLDGLRLEAPDLASHVRYRVADRSSAMLDAVRHETPEAETHASGHVPSGHCGVVLGMEVFDALPVHRLRRHSDRWVEVQVALDDAGRLVETEAEAPGELVELARRYGALPEQGCETEVAPGVATLLAEMADALERGVILLVDYGERAAALYGADRRRGTLLAYHRHTTNEDYLERVGEQDLTAWVNFDALEIEARRLGLEVLGLTTQDRFLIGNGILEAFEQEDAAASRDPRRVKQRMQAMQLIHPQAMGRRFKVLLLAKGCPDAPQLQGLTDPFAR